MVGFYNGTRMAAPVLVALMCISVVHCLENGTSPEATNGPEPYARNATNSSTVQEEPTDTVLGNKTLSSQETPNTTESVPHNATNASSTQGTLDEKPTKSVHTKQPQFLFSRALMQNLQVWNKTIRNASTECSKRISGATTGSHWSIDFPVFASNRRCGPNIRFLPVVDLNPLLVRWNGKKTLVNIASLALLELSPLLVLCLSCATLSGMIIWALDTRANPSHFPKRFWRGLFDGVWWAVVTMTTVGYGDKAPKSFLARLFATFWMIAGIILVSMFTAQVSSRLTAEELKTDDHVFGKKIGVPLGLEGSDYVEDVMRNAIIKEYSSKSDFLNGLRNDILDSALVFNCEDDEEDSSYEVLLFLELCQVGAVMNLESSENWSYNNFMKYVECMNVETILIKKRALVSRDEKDHSCRKLFRQRDKDLTFKWVFFEDFAEYLIPLGGVVGSILFLSILGGIYDIFQKKKPAEKASSKLVEASTQLFSNMDEKLMNASKESEFQEHKV